MKNCMKCIFFEMKKKKDLYLWVSNVPSGPSMKFLVENGECCVKRFTMTLDLMCNEM